MISFRPWVFHLKRGWAIAITFGTVAFSAADQFLPLFQGMIPPIAYAGVALLIALLPSILNRRGKHCDRRERARSWHVENRRCQP